MMKVLLVDDNEINLDIQKYMLESCDLEVDTADCGKDAIKLADENEYDMIFMDIQMPEMDGFETAEKIRSFNSTVPIIALSADKISYTSEGFIRGGMNGSIKKPLRLADLDLLLSSYIPDAKKETPETNNKDVIFDKEGFSGFIPDEASAMGIIRQFLTVHRDDCTILKERIDSGNILGARELMHDIVGISGNLFCRRLYHFASDLGAELRQGHWDSFPDFSDVWEQTVKELEYYCESLLSEKSNNDSKVQDWQELRSDFFSLSSEFDVAAVNLFHTNKKIFAENLDKIEYERLKKAVDNYDFLSIIDME